MPMVSWQVFVSIGFETAKTKGAAFGGISDGSDFVTDLSEVWQSDKERFKQMTERQVRNYLDGVIEA